MYRGRRFPVQYLLHLSRINGNPILGNSVSQEFHTIKPKFTLGKLGIELMISKTLKNNAEVFGMLFLVLGVNQNIINEHHYELVKLGHENRIHEIHEIGRSIGEPE
jgi:hypothetical protein